MANRASAPSKASCSNAAPANTASAAPSASGGNGSTSSPRSFFFQAEDGIRAKLVTGVQTCALPIYTEKADLFRLLDAGKNASMQLTESFAMLPTAAVSGFYLSHPQARYFAVGKIEQIGRASCRERVWSLGVAASVLSHTVLGSDPSS